MISPFSHFLPQQASRRARFLPDQAWSTLFISRGASTEPSGPLVVEQAPIHPRTCLHSVHPPPTVQSGSCRPWPWLSAAPPSTPGPQHQLGDLSISSSYSLEQTPSFFWCNHRPQICIPSLHSPLHSLQPTSSCRISRSVHMTSSSA